MEPLRTLILGGTTEASALARRLAGDPRFDATVSLAGVTLAPRPLPLPSRRGGFGGVAGLVEYLQRNRVRALVDATHPFAAQMKQHAIAAAAQAGVPLLAVLRPGWVAGPGDTWQAVPGMAAAATALGSVPRRVLLTVGQKDLAPFAAAPWHRYTVRSVDPPDSTLLPPGAEVLTATGPFTFAAEYQLLRDCGIQVLVTKNSGGTATEAKLDAARTLGVPVVMVQRPDPPDAETVPNAAGALEWLLRRHYDAALRGV